LGSCREAVSTVTLQFAILDIFSLQLLVLQQLLLVVFQCSQSLLLLFKILFSPFDSSVLKPDFNLK
jgi:hypothetical protein